MTNFVLTCTDTNRGTTWSADVAFATRDEAVAYAAKLRRHQARLGRVVTVEVAA